MNASNRWFIILVLCTLLGNNYATQLVQGNAKPSSGSTVCPVQVTTSFLQSIQTTTYDRANGIFYVGLAADAGDYAVSSFARPVGGQQIPQFKARTPNTDTVQNPLNNQSIQGLAMAEGDGDSCSLVVGYITDDTTVFALNLLNNVSQSASLLGYESVLDKNGSAIDRIVAIAANQCFIFAGVATEPSPLFNFGRSPNDGIAVVAIDRSVIGAPLTTSASTSALYQTAAVPGDNGIKAQAFNDDSTQLRIGNPALPNVEIEGDTVSLFWDDRLQRLYLGVSITTRTTANTGQGLRSVAIAQVGDCPEKGTLIINNIAPDSAFDAANEYIVGVVSPAPATSLTLTCTQLAVMHTSTGPSYAIIHGGNGTATNRIYALPLVDRCNPTDPLQGVLANKKIFNSAKHRFEQPALLPEDMTISTDQFAQVGNGPLPIQVDHTISGLQVIDDAVYVSLQIPQDDNNETGILYSQAQFDTEGKIVSWTEWSKRAWPICGFPDSPSNSQVAFFAVDAVTGNVIAVDGSPSQTVRITRWDDGNICGPCTQNCSLAAVLNDTFCNGIFSVLDLDQSTTGIGPEIPFRYALFGGTNSVAFALTSSSRAPGAPYDINPVTDTPYPQRVTINYCCPDYFLLTDLPDDAGCVRSLEYSRRSDMLTNNYFFAGTQHGLYVFAHQNGNGFAVTELGYLNEGIFSSGSWHKIDAISDPVVAIQSSGNALYVLTFATTQEVPLSSSLLRIPFQSNIATMFAPANMYTIAQTATAPVLDNTLIFTDVEILQTNANSTTEQLALTTNNGLFQTKTVGGSQNATNQTDAIWSLVGDQQLYYGIGAVDNASAKSTVWPFSADDACGCNTFEQSSIHQLNSNLIDPTPTFTFIPDFFNYLITACGCCNPADCVYCPDCCNIEPIAKMLYEKIVYFWSDGGRRFFILSPINAHLAPFCCNNSVGCCPQSQLRYLQVTPFNSCIWNNNAPCSWVLKDCLLQDQSLYYWVRPIGMTGVILAGTEHGVVALE